MLLGNLLVALKQVGNGHNNSTYLFMKTKERTPRGAYRTEERGERRLSGSQRVGGEEL